MTRLSSCTIDGCCGRTVARGLCSRHYHRWQRYGDPIGGNPTFYGEPQQWLADHSKFQGLDCLPWPFGRANNGRGGVTIEGKLQSPARAMCIIAHGEPSADRPHATHSCGNGHLGCCNPNHLRWASVSQNMLDKIAHGTDPRGEKHGSAKLSNSQVLEIRSLKGKVPQSQIASRFGVSKTCVSQIMTGTRWGWLPQPDR